MTLLAFHLSPPCAQAQTTIDTETTVTVPDTQFSPWALEGIGNGTLTVNGTMNVLAKGEVRSTTGVIGHDSESTGVVTVDGNGSTWSNSGYLFVGSGGNGTLSIRGGGSVNNVGGHIGQNTGRSGTVSVDGTGSTWRNRSNLFVGNNGSGTLVIRDGGSVSNVAGWIGRYPDSMGTVTVAGYSSAWYNSSVLFVGHSGDVTLVIRDGGSVSNSAGQIGTNEDSKGVVTVTGAGSIWENSGELVVGRYGAGSLAISTGGLVSVGDVVRVAWSSGSTGTLDLSTGGTLQALALQAGDGTAAATFDGGILRALADNAAFITGFAAGELVLGTDGLSIDDNGYAIATDTSTFGGTGGLRKTGSGTLTLGGASDYYGATMVMAGTLKAGDGDVFSPNSAFGINAGASLDLDGFDQTVASLSNGGSIRTGSEFSANGVGTTLTVSGTYESNGGSLILRTTLGDDSSVTDRLVVGNATTGAGGATKLFIINVGGLGAETSNGIKVVEVGSTSSSDAFVLGAAVTAGAYEYRLEQAANQSWYLTNEARLTSPGNDSKLYNPNIGAVLGNQHAAASMFAHNILDRRESLRAPGQTLWIRARHSALNSDLLDGRQHAAIRTSVVQIGADLFRHEDVVAGIFGGYGHASTDNRSNQTGTKADGRVDGSNIGLYANWMPDENKGPYADVWGTYAWYRNDLHGQAQNRSVTYDSSGYTLSAEAGYGFALATESDGRAWIIKPHAQLSYVSLDADSFTDSHGTRYGDSRGSGMQSRLGARFHGQRAAAGQGGISPFVELNWLYNGVDNTARLDGTKLSSRIGRTVGELKTGLQGKISESLSVWGHLGAQRGTAGFERYEVQFGLGWQW